MYEVPAWMLEKPRPAPIPFDLSAEQVAAMDDMAQHASKIDAALQSRQPLNQQGVTMCSSAQMSGEVTDGAESHK